MAKLHECSQMPKFTFSAPSGFCFRRRGIGFLGGDAWLNAEAVFQGLSGTTEEDIRNRIDHWLGGGVKDKYHHGFPNDPHHDQCYVFKHKSLRFYGFLCNPRPESDKGFRLCVLTEAVYKHQWETETAILNRAMRLLAEREARKAIAVAYPEYGEAKSWKQ